MHYNQTEVSLVDVKPYLDSQSLAVRIASSVSLATTLSGTPAVSLASTVANLGVVNGSRFEDSTSNLGIGAVFNGTARDNGATATAQSFGSFVVTVFADQASAANGLVIQGSTDGTTNWRTLRSATVAINVAKTIGFPTVFRFMRVQYTNGAVATGVLNIQSQYHKFTIAPFES
jgi:hypothetical protein